MRKFSLLIVIIQFYSISILLGQESKMIEGIVVNNAKEPLIGASISVPETSIGTISDLNGAFQLEVPSETKSINVSYVGYKSVEIQPKKTMIITLLYDDTQIDEVVVTAQKPMVQITAEKTTVYPGLSPTTASGNAYSVLKNLPGVIINSDGSVYLNGKSGVKILVDGKNSYLSGTDLVNYLLSLPASSLSKIELIHHPSAKYEASGKSGIIDICTQRSNSLGYKINVNTNYEQGKYERSNNNVSFGYHKNKLNINGMYGYYVGKDYVDLTVSRDFPETATTPSTYFDQDSYRKRKDNNQYFRFGIDYFVSDKTTIGINSRGNKSDRIENGTLNSIFHTQTTQCDSTINSITNNDESKINLISNVYFQHKIDSLGKEISASVDGLFYSIEESQFHSDVLSKLLESSTELASQALKDGSIKMYSGRVDLAYPINENSRFDVGVKSDFVNINNMSDYQIQNIGQWTIDPSLSTSFFYKENINALYLSSKMKKHALTAKTGFRVENTNLENDSTHHSYTNFFPNLMVSWQLRNNNALNFTYDRRIDRPNYRDLNPFVYVFDSYTYEQGNTELKPQFTNRLNLSFTIRKAYKIGLYYTNTQQAIIKSYFVEEDTKRVLVMPTNMSSYYSYGILGDAAKVSFVKWLQSSVHTELVQNNYKWTENGSTMNNNGLTFQLGLQNRIKLPWGWNGEVSGFYNSRMAYGQIDVLSIWQISGGIQRNFFNEQATLNIFAYDWFHSNHTRVEGIINGSHATTDDFTDNAIIGLSFTYRFKNGFDVKKNNNQKEIDTKRISL